MMFGKYKGEEIGDLPENYLRWLWKNIELREPLLSEIREILYPAKREMVAPGMERIKRI